jgi:hypothetical protein
VGHQESPLNGTTSLDFESELTIYSEPFRYYKYPGNRFFRQNIRSNCRSTSHNVTAVQRSQVVALFDKSKMIFVATRRALVGSLLVGWVYCTLGRSSHGMSTFILEEPMSFRFNPRLFRRGLNDAITHGQGTYYTPGTILLFIK